jgi:hypothetical protein
MPFHLYSLLRLVHIASMAFWLAAGVSAPGDIRRTLALGKPHTTALVARVNRSACLTIGSAIATVLTGLALVFSQGGFGAMSARLHVGFALTLATFAVGATLANPAWQRIEKILQADGDLDEARRHGRRFAGAFALESLLKVTILALMIFKF